MLAVRAEAAGRGMGTARTAASAIRVTTWTHCWAMVSGSRSSPRSGVESAEFAAVRDSVEISDATLSKQVALLESARYVDVEKRRVGKARTWLALSGVGRTAYARHVAALRAIARLPPDASDDA